MAGATAPARASLPFFSSGTAPLRKCQKGCGGIVHHTNELLRPPTCVFDEVVSDVFEIDSSFFCPPKLHLRAVCSFGKTTFEPRADVLVREHFSPVNLSEPLLYLTQKPIVILNCPLDGFED